MSIRRVACAFLGLGLGLWFYLAHRSDQTLSNRLVNYLCGPSIYFPLKQELRRWLPLPAVVRGCLPSALWCFIATSLVGGWKIRIGGDRLLELAWLAPFVNAGWELVQKFGWTDGRADWRDAVAGFVGWGMAQLVFFRPARPTEEIFSLWSWPVGVVMLAFGCMGFADVWK
jgi:hypothetical protein